MDWCRNVRDICYSSNNNGCDVMGDIVCNGDCMNCDFEYWSWLKKRHIMIFGNKTRLHECPKVHDDE
jgi:hypothetical protein